MVKSTLIKQGPSVYQSYPFLWEIYVTVFSILPLAVRNEDIEWQVKWTKNDLRNPYWVRVSHRCRAAERKGQRSGKTLYSFWVFSTVTCVACGFSVLMLRLWAAKQGGLFTNCAHEQVMKHLFLLLSYLWAGRIMT